MSQRTRLAWILLLACLPLSCKTSDHYLTDEPPSGDSPQANKWWKARINQWSPEFLAVYAEAARLHQQQQSSAVYFDSFLGVTNKARHFSLTLLPCPPPAWAWPQIQERLQKSPPRASSTQNSGVIPFLQATSKGCTEQEALDLWKQAIHNALGPKERQAPAE